MKVLNLLRKIVLSVKRIFERKQQKQKCQNIFLKKECRVDRNIYVDLEKMKKPSSEEIKFKRDISGCPGCIFGDSSLTCTCRFKQTLPDFKLYEDEEKFMIS